jgi:DNA-binding response OmpR family regulator
MEPGKPKKILVVDDDQKFVAALTTFLSGHGFEVLKVYDATLAMKFARKEPIDLMTLDLGLPAGGGRFVLKNVRKFESTARLPVIVSTANVEEGIREEILGMGASDFIAKPYDLEALLEKIKVLLDPPVSKPSADL